MKFLVWCLVVVLEVPASLWFVMPTQERDRIRDLVMMDYMQKEAQKGATKFIISERVHKFNYQLHIETAERKI